ncbi:MAG TPA: hypothetical protein VJ110_00305 [Candidatus Nanoarchaeia archaeon]|nr:hypothetical protein [Candidatus Nanoarchaeia archaeon]
MLDKATIKQINEFVHQKPRTVQEISILLRVNWRTADRYVENIEKDEGTISTRTFREGTRGALKVVFWNHFEKLAANEAQEHLLRQIESGRRKDDFSPSEIFQFVDKNRGKVVKMQEHEYNSYKNLKNFLDHLKGAKQQVLFFSGNLTWSKLADHDKEILEVLEGLAKKKVSSKVLTRVELAGIDSLKNILAINSRAGWDAVEVRHKYQPLRCTIIDNSVAVLKEVLEPEKYAPNELKEKTYLLYYIYDQEWIEFLQRAFWHLYKPAVSAKRRLEVMKPVFHTY